MCAAARPDLPLPRLSLPQTQPTLTDQPHLNENKTPRQLCVLPGQLKTSITISSSRLGIFFLLLYPQRPYRSSSHEVPPADPGCPWPSILQSPEGVPTHQVSLPYHRCPDPRYLASVLTCWPCIIPRYQSVHAVHVCGCAYRTVYCTCTYTKRRR